MAHHLHHYQYAIRFGRWLAGLATAFQVTMFLIVIFMALASPPPIQASFPTPIDPSNMTGDVGDAPETGMTTYLSSTTPVRAYFPTIYSPDSLSGPLHQNPEAGPHLGVDVSTELNADQFPDEDGIPNIDLPNNKANLDTGDDSLTWIPSLAACQLNRFEVSVTQPSEGYSGQTYLNVWFDFSRDGDWNDSDNGCEANEWVFEWAVQNQLLSLESGTQTIPITVTAYHPVEMDLAPLWVRISMSDAPMPTINGISDGRGPMEGFAYGETEDYLLRYTTISCPPDVQCSRQAGWQG